MMLTQADGKHPKANIVPTITLTSAKTDNSIRNDPPTPGFFLKVVYLCCSCLHFLMEESEEQED